MAQAELIEVLRKERLCGNHEFMSPKEIYKLLNEISPRRIRDHINKLYAYGFLQIEKEKVWMRKYRLKNKYLKQY